MAKPSPPQSPGDGTSQPVLEFFLPTHTIFFITPNNEYVNIK